MLSISRFFWQILNQSQKISGLKLVIITFIGSILEAVGVGLVVPFIAIILSENYILPNSLIQLWPELVLLDKSQLVTISVVIFLLFYFVKSLFLMWVVTRQTGYYYSLQESISGKLFKFYLNKDYAFHLNNNSAKLLSNTITETMQFSIGFTASFFLILNDLFIVISILFVLIIIEPFGAILALIFFGLSSLLLFISSKKRAALWGESRLEKERLRIKSAQEGFNGIKDIKLYGREGIFINNYITHTCASLDAGRKQTILQNVPRIFLEFVAVFALCGIVIFLSTTGDTAEIITLVGLFAAAAFKLLPTISRLVQHSQTIVFNIPVVSLIHNELFVSMIPIHSNNNTSGDNIKFESKLNLTNLNFCYEGVDKTALDSVNLDLDAGKMFGFIGSSGAGKSTLIDCILGLIEPSSGSLSVDGEVITKENVKGWQKNIGYVPQVIYLLDGTLRENIAFGIPQDSINDENLKDALDKAKLSNFVNELPSGLDTFVGERGVRLSGGQRQRIGIARALYNNPSVLVLDEATSALDTDTEREVMNAVESLHGNKTILIIAHRFSTIENCDYIYKLGNGKVVAEGTPTEVLDNDLCVNE